MTGISRFFEKTKKTPTQRENEFFDLVWKKTSVLLYIDNLQSLITMLSGFNKVIRVDMAKSPHAISILFGTAGFFAYSGLSFSVANKLLSIGKAKLCSENIKLPMPYTLMYTTTNCSSGHWSKVNTIEELVVDEALKAGDLFNLTTYIMYSSIVATERGDFSNTEYAINKLSEIGTVYDFDIATVYAIVIRIYLLFKKGTLFEALAEAERGVIFSAEHSTELIQQRFFSWKAEAQILLKNVNGAEESLLQAKKIIDQQKFVPPTYIMPYLIAQFIKDIYLLKEAIFSNDKEKIIKLKEKAYKSGKIALKKVKRFVPEMTYVLRLMGEYNWLTGKQNKAFKWWEKAIAKGKELGARPDLSRTYLQIGKSLLDPKSNYKEWNGIAAQEYLNKAKIMFQEMGLQYDLDELDKIVASN